MYERMLGDEKKSKNIVEQFSDIRENEIDDVGKKRVDGVLEVSYGKFVMISMKYVHH